MASHLMAKPDMKLSLQHLLQSKIQKLITSRLPSSYTFQMSELLIVSLGESKLPVKRTHFCLSLSAMWYTYHSQKEQAERNQKTENSRNDGIEMDDMHCSMRWGTFFYLSTCSTVLCSLMQSLDVTSKVMSVNLNKITGLAYPVWMCHTKTQMLGGNF